MIAMTEALPLAPAPCGVEAQVVGWNQAKTMRGGAPTTFSKYS